MEINWLAIIAAAISSLVVGFIWYNPKVFGTIWMKETGMTEEKAQQGNMPLIFGMSLVLAFLMCIMLSMVVSHGHGNEEFNTFKHGAFHGALTAIFIVLPALGVNAMYEQRSYKYILINVGYWVVTMAVMGGILAAWSPALPVE